MKQITIHLHFTHLKSKRVTVITIYAQLYICIHSGTQLLGLSLLFSYTLHTKNVFKIV